MPENRVIPNIDPFDQPLERLNASVSDDQWNAPPDGTQQFRSNVTGQTYPTRLAMEQAERIEAEKHANAEHNKLYDMSDEQFDALCPMPNRANAIASAIQRQFRTPKSSSKR